MYIVLGSLGFFCNLYCVCVTSCKNVSMRTFTEKQIFSLVFLHTKYVALSARYCRYYYKKKNIAQNRIKVTFVFFSVFINKSSIFMFFVLFFHVVCKISNFDMWTTKHLVQVFCCWTVYIFSCFVFNVTIITRAQGLLL